MLTRFWSVEELFVTSCSSLEKVFEQQELNVNENQVVTTIQLKCLLLARLPQMKHVFPASIARSLMHLENLKIIDCGVEEIVEGEGREDAIERVVFPIPLSSVDLEETQRNQHRSRLSCRLTTMEAMLRFQNLSNLEVQGSCNIKYLLSFSTARFMVHLKHLHISECNTMEEVLVPEEIVAAGEITKEVFPGLECLKLTDLPNLKRFCIGCNIQFPSMENLWIDHCPKLETFILNPVNLGPTTNQEIIHTNAEERPPTIMQHLFNVEVAFPCLKRLSIRHMDYLKLIWQNQFAENSFCNLEIIKVELCENLVSIFQFKMLKIFQSLESMHVGGCGSLKQVFDLQGPSFQEPSAVTVTQLKNLYLSDLPKLKHILNKDPHDILSFQNLRDVLANGCKSMECLFPASMARTLTELESLEVIDCGVEVIVEKEEAEGRLVFPKLTSLALGALPKLKWIFPGAHNLEWPMLKKLRAWGCDQAQIFASKLIRSFQETNQQCLLESSIQHPLFLVEESTFPKLEALTSDLHDTTWHDQFLIESFCNLKVLEVQCNHDTSAIFLSNLLTKLQNLEKLVVSCNSWQEIFSYEEFIGPGKHARLLPRLKELRVSQARMLTHLWKEDVQDSLVFHKVLEILAVSKCHKLKNLAPSSVCFQNLTDLEILSCNGLINLIAYPTAKSLVQLRKMSVSSCEGITEIVAKGDEQAKVVITFSKLTCLKLRCLVNFTSFCSGSYSIMFPYLKEVIVVECPKMKTFCHGVLSTTKLESVDATTRGEKSHIWKHDLNATIHSLWEDKPV